MRSVVIVAVAAASLAGACTGSSREASSGDSATSGTTVTGTDPAEPLATEPDDTEPDDTDLPTSTVVVAEGPAIVDGVANSLVVVHDRDGGADVLASYQADGTKVTSYSTDSDAVIRQPIWSPDGRRIAWSSSSDGVTWELITSAVDGSERTSHSLPAMPDYLAYDPTASRVLALTPSLEGFGLVIVDLDDVDETATDQPFTVIDLGQPYFSDFSPTGDRVIAHVANDMRVVDLAGERQSLGFRSVGHQTPAWHPSDEVVFFTTETDAGNQLVSHRLTTGDTSELATFDAFVFFDVDPTGARLAVSAFEVGSEGGLDALRTIPGQPAPTELGSGLWIVDLVDGTTSRVDELPTVAPMWDPTGSRFLVRTTIRGPGRWNVYELHGTRVSTADYDISDSLLPAYLPFWDQYVRSQTLWSPDGRQFVHVGRAEGGQSGVWIHDANSSGPSTFLTDGDLAFWSPT